MNCFSEISAPFSIVNFPSLLCIFVFSGNLPLVWKGLGSIWVEYYYLDDFGTEGLPGHFSSKNPPQII